MNLANVASGGYVRGVKERSHPAKEQDMNRIRTVRRLAIAAFGIGLFAGGATAQPPRPAQDPLAAARQQVADQKVEADVNAAIADAERLAKTNREKAVRTLKTAQGNIDLAVAISGDARKKYTELLQQRIAILEGRPLPNAGVKPDPVASSTKKDREAAFQSYLAELKDVKEGVDRFAKFQQAGLKKDAEQELAKLAKAYPNNPSIISLQQRDNLNTQITEAVAFNDLAQRRVNEAFKAVDRAALPIGGNGDIEFPKDWKEKTERRLQKVQLTAAEKKIIESLNKPVTVNWNGKPLDEAMQELSNTLDQKLFLDEKSINDLGIDLRKPFSLQANGVSAKTVLRQVLASQGLTFVVKDQVIQIVDVERAKNMLVTRVYYLGDVVRGVGPFGGLEWGPFVNHQQTMSNVETIMKAITSSIDPLSWKEKGGPASVTFDYPSMSIIVRASAEVHFSLGATLAGGR
jgi:hypothetical protein